MHGLRLKRVLRLAYIGVAAFLLTTPCLFAQSPAPTTNSRFTDAESLMRIFDLMLQHHIEAPTRQQLVLETIVGLYCESDSFDRTQWATKISHESDRNKLVEMIREAQADIETDFEKAAFEVLDNHGVSIQPTKEAIVASQIAANRYVGIGVAISKQDDGPAVFANIIPGGTAESAGIRAGEQLLSANGEKMTDISLPEIIDSLRGPEGSELSVTIRSPEKEERTVTMIRRVVPFKTVGEPIFSTSGKSAIIYLENITSSSVHELRQIAAKLDDKIQLVVIGCKNHLIPIDVHNAVVLASGLFGEGQLGPIKHSDGASQVYPLSGERIFGNRQIKLVVDSKTQGVWAWIAAANKNQDSSSAEAQKRKFYRHIVDPNQLHVSPKHKTQYAWQLETISVPNTDLAAIMPTGLFCDIAGEILQPPHSTEPFITLNRAENAGTVELENLQLEPDAIQRGFNRTQNELGPIPYVDIIEAQLLGSDEDIESK